MKRDQVRIARAAAAGMAAATKGRSRVFKSKKAYDRKQGKKVEG